MEGEVVAAVGVVGVVEGPGRVLLVEQGLLVAQGLLAPLVVLVVGGAGFRVAGLGPLGGRVVLVLVPVLQAAVVALEDGELLSSRCVNISYYMLY